MRAKASAGSHPRRTAIAALLALAAALPTSSCGSEDGDTGAGAKTTDEADALLKVEAAEGPRGTELIVYVVDERANSTATARGRRTVELRCFDKAHRVIVSKPHPWPFTDTDDGLTDAHVHQRVPRTRAGQVSRCELQGTRGPLAGEVTSTSFQ